MSEDKENVFLPLEEIAEIADLRLAFDEAKTIEAESYERVLNSDIYENFRATEDLKNGIKERLDKAEVDFKAGCEAIYLENGEKVYPGGKINLMTGLEYKEDLAIRYAMHKKLPELLKLNVKEFKKVSPRPVFIIETKTPKLKMDTDLTEYLGGGDG